MNSSALLRLSFTDFDHFEQRLRMKPKGKTFLASKFVRIIAKIH